MFLNYLIIRKNGKQLRNIKFKEGVNFIVDKTPGASSKESGNSVGKTSVLRLIDYCLGSDGKDIYFDQEFKSTHSDVKDFLIANNVEVELCLVDNLNAPKKKIVIVRNFLEKKDGFISINDEQIKKGDFAARLNKEIFLNSNDKPSFRNLIAKFIRDDANAMAKTLKFLDPHTTTVQYEAVHLFLLGIKFPDNLLDEKQKLHEKLKTDEKVFIQINIYLQ